MRAVSEALANRVMDSLMEYDQTSDDLADNLECHVSTIQDCLCCLCAKGLIAKAGKVHRHVLWTMARTRKAS